MEDYSDVCSHVCSATSDIEIWWVDDCFTHASKDEDDRVLLDWVEEHGLDYFESDSPSVNPNRRVARKLIEICENTVNLYFCSFEFAEDNFDRIDRKENGVLLDFNHLGRGEAFGLNLYRRKVIQRKGRPSALFSFLTVIPERIIDFDNWLPQVPFPIEKNSSRYPHQLESFVEHVREMAPRRSSVIDAEDWAEMRTVALRASEEERPNGLFSEHHVPCGGADEITQAAMDFHDDVFERVAEQFPFTYRFPEYCWNKKMSDIRVWDQPPQRSLIQFDDKGRDLSILLHLLSADLMTLRDVNSSVHVPPLEEDYLWFNAPALAHSLFKLAQGFSDKLAGISSTRSAGDGESGETEKNRSIGTFSVDVWEVKNEGRFQNLAIEVCQGKLIQGFQDNSIDTTNAHRSAQFDAVSLPTREEAVGAVRESYTMLEEKCGADIGVNDDCLQVAIPAKRMEVEEFDIYVVNAE